MKKFYIGNIKLAILIQQYYMVIINIYFKIKMLAKYTQVFNQGIT